MRTSGLHDSALEQTPLGPEWRDRLAMLSRLHNIMMVVQDNHIAYINPIGATKLGFEDASALIGIAFSELFHPDYKDFAELGMDVLADEETILSVKLKGFSDKELDAELWVSALDEGSNAVYMAEAHDITKHLHTAKELRIREKRLEGIINTVADGVITVDDSGIIQSFNPAAESIFGFKASEIIGHNVRVLLPKPVVQNKNAVSGRDLVSLLSKEGEAEGQRKDGDVFPMEIAVRKLKTGEELTFTSIVRDISERKRREERIAHMAHHDHLTGLPNRHVINDRLASGFERSKRHKLSLGLLFVDLDQFKPINDTYGHAVGDEVLRLVADRMLNTVRKSDTVARVGGDEFIILLEELHSVQDAELVAENMLAQLTKTMIVEGHNHTIGASIGVAVFPDHAETASELLDRADRAMYAVKATGRNAWKTSNPDDGDGDMPAEESETKAAGIR